MKLYVFEFEGVWLGGAAVVLAETEEQALALLKEHHGGEPAELLCAQLQSAEAAVVYYDDGDY